MTYEALLDKLEDIEYWQEQYAGKTFLKAIRAVVELHKPSAVPDWVPKQVDFICDGCARAYPCPTTKAIEKELQ